ncbi:WbuC family cupin fold metalloprotein [Alphaproteobacteria bacterium]|nr:WbuC family cupin fold metalloprotein [Alphaproteobacteria bacterium]
MNLYSSNNKFVKNNVAVKAIIYRSDGKILLQQRDSKKGLPFPSFWNFFGGLVEGKENHTEALKRELEEELSCVPGVIDKKIFEWSYGNEWNKSLNIFFAIKFNKNNQLKLNEGRSLKWFRIEEVININCTPAIYQNFNLIYNFLSKKLKFNKNYTKKIEEKLLQKNKLFKKNSRVFYSQNKNFQINKQQIYLLKELAILKKVKVFRVCLHHNDEELVHEMLMIHTSKTVVGPLMQKKNNISYNIIDGDLSILICNTNKKILKKYQLNSNKEKIGNSQIIRIEANKFRIVQSNSKYCIFIETTLGPFNDSDTIWLH